MDEEVVHLIELMMIGALWHQMVNDEFDDEDDNEPMRNEAFRLHFRMNTETLKDLVHLLGNFMGDNEVIHANEDFDLRRILLLVLWILATPDPFRSVALRFGVTPGVLHYHYKYVTWPCPKERAVIKDLCERRSGFPGIVGAVDASYITLCSAPHNEPQRYVNRHHSYAVTLQAVADPALQFRDIHVGEPGSLHDSRIFRRSPVSRKLLEDETLVDQDEHILGDSAYILTNKVLTPFRNNGDLTPLQTNYNRRLSSSRSMVERAFGLLKMKWRRLFFLLARNPEIVVRTIAAFVMLHNFILMRGEPPEVVDEPIQGLEENFDPYADFDHVNVGVEPDHPLQQNARYMGVEKRLHIMNNLPIQL
ncbi:Putative nuclease [Frankliniella fusca]|uniref:Nuclease n=1 Tax=Frankliniella fusca TaxID=407009 RepID=A0AAE1GZI7_9NEOP|nr:Putative nuclease [Frankliniella fusca]